jgi:hypothetical protein
LASFISQKLTKCATNLHEFFLNLYATIRMISHALIRNVKHNER